MLQNFYTKVIQYPKSTIIIMLALTLVFAWQLDDLRWETDARVYLPKGHPAIIYDEKVDAVFGVKDSVIIGVVNEEEGIFNARTLARIADITDKVANLPGVIATRSVDIASLSTAYVFSGTDDSLGTRSLMPTVPVEAEEIERLKRDVYDNADLFVGNIVSEDGTAAVIRAKLKEGAANRYMTYFQLRGILGQGQGGDWGQQQWSGEGNEWWDKEGADGSPTQGQSQPGQQGGENSAWWNNNKVGEGEESPDKIYLAGRPVIEVTSGQHAMQDMMVMIPILILAMVVMLFVLFRTLRAIVLPLLVMSAAIVWTMGLMPLLDVPLYTISTMLPVILVAVGIGDSVHLLSHYYDKALQDTQRSSQEIVREVMEELGPPMITTSLTTSIGFLSLLFAEMPPFKVFGLFTVAGIMFCWLLSVTIIPAALTLMRPKVGGYLAKRRSLRIYSEQGWVTRLLVQWGRLLYRARALVAGIVIVIVVIAGYGLSALYVNSSWMSDFKEGSEVTVSNDLLNDKFDGTVFLNVVVEEEQEGALKSPQVLTKIQALQDRIEEFPMVGDSLSVVDYLRSMNKSLHADKEEYRVLPSSREEIAEYLFLYSISGRPELLDQVIDYSYKQANVSFSIKTDYTLELKKVIDEVNLFASREFEGTGVKINLAGSANNSYIWADLLISSQTAAILFSKIGIFLLAALMFRSFMVGLYVVLPVSVATLIVGGLAGLLGIPVDVSTTLAAGVAIGVGVDYAIHFLFRYAVERRKHDDPQIATLSTLRSVGKTIVFHASVVTIGFMVLLFSQFPPHAKLGEFVGAYMIISCLAAIIVLPLCLSYSKPQFVMGSTKRALSQQA